MIPMRTDSRTESGAARRSRPRASGRRSAPSTSPGDSARRSRSATAPRSPTPSPATTRCPVGRESLRRRGAARRSPAGAGGRTCCLCSPRLRVASVSVGVGVVLGDSCRVRLHREHGAARRRQQLAAVRRPPTAATSAPLCAALACGRWIRCPRLQLGSAVSGPRRSGSSAGSRCRRRRRRPWCRSSRTASAGRCRPGATLDQPVTELEQVAFVRGADVVASVPRLRSWPAPAASASATPGRGPARDRRRPAVGRWRPSVTSRCTAAWLNVSRASGAARSM